MYRCTRASGQIARARSVVGQFRPLSCLLRVASVCFTIALTPSPRSLSLSLSLAPTPPFLAQIFKLDYVYIRGSHVRFVIVPDMLKNNPMFKRFTPKDKARATGNAAKTVKK